LEEGIMVKRMSAKEAREQFSDLIGSVHYSQEPVIVEVNP
jgi:sulfur carrier protein ThiS